MNISRLSALVTSCREKAKPSTQMKPAIVVLGIYSAPIRAEPEFLRRAECPVDPLPDHLFVVESTVGTSRHFTSSNTSTKSRFHVKQIDRKSTRLNSSHVAISYAVFC